MDYRKFRADHLFTGSHLLDNHILVTKPDGEIVAVVDQEEAGEDIEIFEGILTPGFVNTHCHLELSHMKGLIPQKTGLVDFVYKVITERHFDEEEITGAISRADEQMTLNGIVAVGDICNNTLTLQQKLGSRLNYYNFIEASGWAPSLAQSRWEKSKTLFDTFASQNLTASIVPHAPYSVSNDLWRKMIPFFQHKTVTIHNQESIHENEFFLKGSGDLLRMYEKLNIDNSFFSPAEKTSLQSFFPNLSQAASVILVHNTFISQADIDYIFSHRSAQQLISFCLCPTANLYIEDCLPPVEMLQKNDCRITLGSDSLASNQRLDILEEMKTILLHFPAVSLESVLAWATLNGARALQLDNIFGSFEKGKRPGVVLIEKVDGIKLNKASCAKRIL